jgi:hypothetical protein
MNPLAQALILLFPSMAPWVRSHPEIPQAIVQAAETHGVPAHILMAVCFTESRLGADMRTQLTCGVYRTPRDRQADAAAHAIARWNVRCGSWRRALRMFRGSLCSSPDPHGYVPRVMALAERLRQAAQPRSDAHPRQRARPRRESHHGARR